MSAETTTPISALRDTQFARATGLAVVVAFLAMILSPGAQAAREQLGRGGAPTAERMPAQPDAAARTEAQLRELLPLLLEAVRPARDLVINRTGEQEEGRPVIDLTILGSPHAPAIHGHRQRLREIAAQLKDQDAEVLAGFVRDLVHIEGRQLPQTIRNRHHQAIERFRSNARELQDKIEALGNTTTAIALYDRTAELMNTLEAWRPKPPPVDPDNLPFQVFDGKVRPPLLKRDELRQMLQAPLNSAAAGALPTTARRVELAPAELAQLERPTTLSEYRRLGFEPIQLASLGTPAGGLAATPPGPEYLAPTEDVQITPEIEALAAELDHDPVAIYNLVHDQIEFVPTYGSIQGSAVALQTRRANAFDTASLLIALLRASNIPARYAYGSVDIPAEKAMNWVGGVAVPDAALQILAQGGIPSTGLAEGGVVKFVRVEHVWVEAWVDFFPSGGARNIAPDAWVPMDASFKQYVHNAGLDIAAAVPVDAEALAQDIQQHTTVNETEGWISGLDQTKLGGTASDIATRLEAFLGGLDPATTAGELLGSARIVASAAPLLSGSLPYRVSGQWTTLASLPASMQPRFGFELFGSDADYSAGVPVLRHEISLAALGTKSVVLEFVAATQEDEETLASFIPEPREDGRIHAEDIPTELPGYLIQVVPRLRVGGEIVAQGPAVDYGTTLPSRSFISRLHGGTHSARNNAVAGEFQVITVNAGLNAGAMQAIETELQAHAASLAAGELESLSADRLLTPYFHALGRGYFAQLEAYFHTFNRKSGVLSYLHPGFGTFQTAARVKERYGTPYRVAITALRGDVDAILHTSWSKENRREDVPGYVQNFGTFLSALEHQTLDATELAPGQPAVSTTRLLGQAGADGQRLYRITAQNLHAVLPSLGLAADAEADIRNGVAAGLEATIHESPVTVGAWSGFGYTLVDPISGSGAYRISGGHNGTEKPISGPAAAAVGAFFGGLLSVLLNQPAAVVATMFTNVPLLVSVLGYVGLIAALAKLWLDPDAPVESKILKTVGSVFLFWYSAAMLGLGLPVFLALALIVFAASLLSALLLAVAPSLLPGAVRRLARLSPGMRHLTADAWLISPQNA